MRTCSTTVGSNEAIDVLSVTAHTLSHARWRYARWVCGARQLWLFAPPTRQILYDVNRACVQPVRVPPCSADPDTKGIRPVGGCRPRTSQRFSRDLGDILRRQGARLEPGVCELQNPVHARSRLGGRILA